MITDKRALDLRKMNGEVRREGAHRATDGGALPVQSPAVAAETSPRWKAAEAKVSGGGGGGSSLLPAGAGGVPTTRRCAAGTILFYGMLSEGLQQMMMETAMAASGGGTAKGLLDPRHPPLLHSNNNDNITNSRGQSPRLTIGTSRTRRGSLLKTQQQQQQAQPQSQQQQELQQQQQQLILQQSIQQSEHQQAQQQPPTQKQLPQRKDTRGSCLIKAHSIPGDESSVRLYRALSDAAALRGAADHTCGSNTTDADDDVGASTNITFDKNINIITITTTTTTTTTIQQFDEAAEQERRKKEDEEYATKLAQVAVENPNRQRYRSFSDSKLKRMRRQQL